MITVGDTVSVEDVTAVLEAWSRWARSRGGGRRCGSAEGRYRAPAAVDAGDGTPVIYPDGVYITCEHAWRNMPEPYKTIIRMWHIDRMPDAVIARRVRIRPSDIERYHRCAVTLFGELFNVWHCAHC